ncbi:PREDICTED: defensin [Nicrophorus vespilloides]|uniref:Defensin n=1 Tax=Nicrophorus vespilloides TaxID=110193 RepID=A0ABM1M7U3_NICVS|nr:PREDICTED: defensin [Nicrophorus vespilloides]
MKFFFALVALCLMVASFVSAGPVEQDAEGQVVERANRQRRVTCDLLSVSTPYGSVNHSVCAAHCLAMLKGFRGGRCIDGVCNCRK